jgi:hypothetical protein
MAGASPRTEWGIFRTGGGVNLRTEWGIFRMA